MSKLRIEMTNGCVAVIEDDAAEIGRIVSKMMTESRIETAISGNDQTPADVPKRKESSGKRGRCPRTHPWIPITQEEALNNLKRESEEPMTTKKFCLCLGFEFHKYGTAGSFGGSVHVLLRNLEKKGVKFIYRGTRRYAICRDEQLKSLEVIFKK